MKPQYQTRTGVPNGNCLLACIASVIEIDLDKTPDINAEMEAWFKDQTDDRWWNKLGFWLHDKGYHAMMFGSSYRMPAGATIIAIGPQLSNDQLHAVVYRDGLPRWDPNPNSPSGLGAIVAWLWVARFVTSVSFGPPGTYPVMGSNLTQ